MFLILKAGGSLETCFSSQRDGQNKQVPKPESIHPPQAASLLSVDHQLVEILRPSRSSSVRLDKLSSPSLSVRLISFKRD